MTAIAHNAQYLPSQGTVAQAQAKHTGHHLFVAFNPVEQWVLPIRKSRITHHASSAHVAKRIRKAGATNHG